MFFLGCMLFRTRCLLWVDSCLCRFFWQRLLFEACICEECILFAYVLLLVDFLDGHVWEAFVSW